MLSLARRVYPRRGLVHIATAQLRHARTEAGTDRPPRNRRRSKFSPSAMLRKPQEKSEWWVIDGEMHEIGENVPLRERFVIPRDNIPNKRRKQLREQFMRRTRLVLKESEHEPWCKRYMELYNELRENWERLYWDDGYSKKLAQDHANYDSPDDDEEDFNPYRNRQPRGDHNNLQFVERNKERDTWQKASQVRDKFEYDRERRMREKAFAPMTMNAAGDLEKNSIVSKNEPFDIRRYISESDDENSIVSKNEPFDNRRYVSESDDE